MEKIIFISPVRYILASAEPNMFNEPVKRLTRHTVGTTQFVSKCIHGKKLTLLFTSKLEAFILIRVAMDLSES